VDWFDCRATNNLTENELFAGLAGVQILKSGVVTQFSAIALSSTNALSAHVCCYGIRWRGVPSKLALGVTGVPVLRRLFLQNNGVLWRLGALLRKHELEESWCFASNVGIPEYFLLLGVDASGLRRLMAESSHNEVALSKARWEQELLRVRAGRSLGTELEAADQTVKVAEAAVQRSQLDEVWNAYKIWLEHNARIPAEPGGPANQSQPVRPETSRVSPAAGSGR
jgi:hypothetical protein